MIEHELGSGPGEVLAWRAPGGQPMLSLVFGSQLHFDPQGRCEFVSHHELQRALEYYPSASEGPLQPTALARDVDLYPFRPRTDLVIQGVARHETPITEVQLSLRVRGRELGFDLPLALSGDRRVERGLHGLQISRPASFTEMPLSYTRAYGGTDELAYAHEARSHKARALRRLVAPAELTQTSASSYPRNPAGRGYVIERDSLLGTMLPNIEFPDQRARLDNLLAPKTAWSQRPYPAGFDWFSHRWFPRSALLAVPARGRIKQVPSAELALGVMEPDHLERPLRGRISHRLCQGAHPYLWRHRFRGDESIEVDMLGEAGAPLRIDLPGLAPRARLHIAGSSTPRTPAHLDLVFIEAEQERLTLLWRTSFATGQQPLHPNWRAQCSYTLYW